MEQAIREVKIRRMEVSDIGPLANIEKQCFSRPWSEREFGHLVGETDALYLVADVTFEDGMRKIVGTAGMRILGAEGDIDNVAVLPEYRNLGIAGKLLALDPQVLVLHRLLLIRFNRQYFTESGHGSEYRGV